MDQRHDDISVGRRVGAKLPHRRRGAVVGRVAADHLLPDSRRPAAHPPRERWIATRPPVVDRGVAAREARSRGSTQYAGAGRSAEERRPSTRCCTVTCELVGSVVPLDVAALVARLSAAGPQGWRVSAVGGELGQADRPSLRRLKSPNPGGHRISGDILRVLVRHSRRYWTAPVAGSDLVVVDAFSRRRTNHGCHKRLTEGLCCGITK